MNININIAKDFSDVPAGRNSEDGEFNGEVFRDKHLKPALEKIAKGDKVIVNINDVEGYGSSFLEEAFGGLIRTGDYKYQDLKEKMEIKSNSVFSMYKKIIESYMEDANNRILYERR